MPIETTILSTRPMIVYHRMSGAIGEEEARRGAASGVSLIAHAASGGASVGLIVDLRGYAPNDLNAHRIWATGFKEHPILKAGIRHGAIVGDESPRMRAEQALMESGTLRFFTDPQEARDWLRAAAC